MPLKNALLADLFVFELQIFNKNQYQYKICMHLGYTIWISVAKSLEIECFLFKRKWNAYEWMFLFLNIFSILYGSIKKNNLIHFLKAIVQINSSI